MMLVQIEHVAEMMKVTEREHVNLARILRPWLRYAGRQMNILAPTHAAEPSIMVLPVAQT